MPLEPQKCLHGDIQAVTMQPMVSAKLTDEPGKTPANSANGLGFDGKTDSLPGVVYFIRAGRTPFVKIGWALDAYRRLDELQCGNPHPLHLIGYAAGSRRDEARWHAEWNEVRVRGEWFRLSNPLRMAINDRLFLSDATQYLHIALDRRALAAGFGDPFEAVASIMFN